MVAASVCKMEVAWASPTYKMRAASPICTRVVEHTTWAFHSWASEVVHMTSASPTYMKEEVASASPTCMKAAGRMTSAFQISGAAHNSSVSPICTTVVVHRT